jgi:hypothetical protein
VAEPLLMAHLNRKLMPEDASIDCQKDKEYGEAGKHAKTLLG